MHPILHLSDQAITAVTDELQTTLATYQVLYVKLQKYHWNATTDLFFDVHEKFEELYLTAFEHIDVIAERIRGFGGEPIGSMKQFLDLSLLQESNNIPEPMEMVEEIIDNYGVLISQLRKISSISAEHSDEGTRYFIGKVLLEIEKQVWMLTEFKSAS